MIYINHFNPLMRLTGLEPAPTSWIASLVLRVCQFRHNRKTAIYIIFDFGQFVNMYRVLSEFNKSLTLI